METKQKKSKIAFFIFLGMAAWIMPLAFIILPHLPDFNFALLNPKGIVALKQKNLILTALLIMLIAVIPAYTLLFFSIFKSHPEAKDDADSGSDKKLQVLWWVLPSLVIAALAVIIVKSTHDLDPYKPILSDVKPITIQVVALRWKWLFIYPEQGIAAVNFMEFPVNTPINFELTADGPMNTFWIPQLGGQIYAMAAMTTKLHLMADHTGEFLGSSSEISGEGYSGMRFVAKSVSKTDFDAWAESIQTSANPLTLQEYNKLAEPSENNSQTFYSSTEKNLFHDIIMKYMIPKQ